MSWRRKLKCFIHGHIVDLKDLPPGAYVLPCLECGTPVRGQLTYVMRMDKIPKARSDAHGQDSESAVRFKMMILLSDRYRGVHVMGCGDCPFFYEDRMCRASEFDVNDDHDRETLPGWCPLRNGPITVRAEPKSLSEPSKQEQD